MLIINTMNTWIYFEVLSAVCNTSLFGHGVQFINKAGIDCHDFPTSYFGVLWLGQRLVLWQATCSQNHN